MLYALRCSPARTLCFGAGAQCTLVMAGKLAAHFAPSMATTLQIIINAPIAIQWFIGLTALAAVREQRYRYDVLTKTQGVSAVSGYNGEEED